LRRARLRGEQGSFLKVASAQPLLEHRRIARCAAGMTKWPPPGMASRAFTQRFIST
jgi:hypothetical protein